MGDHDRKSVDGCAIFFRTAKYVKLLSLISAIYPGTLTLVDALGQERKIGRGSRTVLFTGPDGYSPAVMCAPRPARIAATAAAQ